MCPKITMVGWLGFEMATGGIHPTHFRSIMAIPSMNIGRFTVKLPKSVVGIAFVFTTLSGANPTSGKVY